MGKILLVLGTILILNSSGDRATAEVTITITNRVMHQMRSGVGASWHAMLFPTLSHGGSAFGGSPPVIPQHERLWHSMEKHADWLALKFIRAEMEWRYFEPHRGQYAWDAPEMKVLERILAWAQRQGSDVMLQCMWVNLPWQAFPEYRGDPALEQASAPADLDAWADGWVALLSTWSASAGTRASAGSTWSTSRISTGGSSRPTTPNGKTARGK